jgi:two-component system CheB/CheR fusion protein
MDIVSCRNVLIYLSPSLQRRVVPIFHYALNPTGFLMVGNEEGLVGTAEELFDLADRKHKIYRKKPDATRPVLFGLAPGRYEAGIQNTLTASGPARETESPRGPLDVQREADRLLLAKYVPAAVVVNDHLEILQSRGHTGRYLELPPGKASLNLLKMARPGLLFELQKALDKARKIGTGVRKENIQVENNGGEKAVNVEVIPFKIPSGNHQENFLIVFEDSALPSSPVMADATAQRSIRDSQAAKLKQELVATKEYLQSIIEEQEATNEELQSANEEIQSGNEELQSTNEELQTSKEELESANEELNTVNEEMQHRNLQLTQANNDLTNLLNSVNIPTVMLGPDLSVRRFTAQAEKVLGLSAKDVGRPIANLKFKINAPDMEQIMLDVIRDVVTEQREIQDDHANWYRLRISPYRTMDNKIEGVVMTLLDITDLKQPGNLSGKGPGQPKASPK